MARCGCGDPSASLRALRTALGSIVRRSCSLPWSLRCALCFACRARVAELTCASRRGHSAWALQIARAASRSHLRRVFCMAVRARRALCVLFDLPRSTGTRRHGRRALDAGVLAEIALFLALPALFRRAIRARRSARELAAAALRFAVIGWACTPMSARAAQCWHALTFGAISCARNRRVHGFFGGSLRRARQALYHASYRTRRRQPEYCFPAGAGARSGPGPRLRSATFGLAGAMLVAWKFQNQDGVHNWGPDPISRSRRARAVRRSRLRCSQIRRMADGCGLRAPALPFAVRDRFRTGRSAAPPTGAGFGRREIERLRIPSPRPADDRASAGREHRAARIDACPVPDDFAVLRVSHHCAMPR